MCISKYHTLNHTIVVAFLKIKNSFTGFQIHKSKLKPRTPHVKPTKSNQEKSKNHEIESKPKNKV